MYEKKDRKCSKALVEKFKSYDIYGEPIALTYKGEGAYKTNIGAAVSIIVLLVLAAYAAMRLKVMATYAGTSVTAASFILDLNLAGAFSPADVGFDFSFGIGTPLDPAIGNY